MLLLLLILLHAAYKGTWSLYLFILHTVKTGVLAPVSIRRQRGAQGKNPYASFVRAIRRTFVVPSLLKRYLTVPAQVSTWAGPLARPVWCGNGAAPLPRLVPGARRRLGEAMWSLHPLVPF